MTTSTEPKPPTGGAAREPRGAAPIPESSVGVSEKDWWGRLTDLELPKPAEVRDSVARTIGGVQDAVVTAPAKAQDFVTDIRERVEKTVAFIREALGR